MKRKSLVAALALTVFPAFTASAATTFHFVFEGSLGTGIFESIDLSPGTYDLASLPFFSVEFSFPSNPPIVLSNTDIITPIDQIVVNITQFAPGVESLIFNGIELDTPDVFTRILRMGTDETGGAVYQLSDFEPPPIFGHYLALSSIVPEPSTWAMMVLGFAGLAFAGYRLRSV